MGSFALIREGSSDDGLLSHLRQLVVRAGATEAIGTSRVYTGRIVGRLRLLAAEPDTVDLLFIHRDSDSRDDVQRYAEVENAIAEAGVVLPVVSVVPVQELEAWLLVDEEAIRSVVGKPRGTRPLDLPKVSKVEATSQPKELLMAALLTASETTGRRREKERKAFNQRRRALLERRDPDGFVARLSAWQSMEDQIRTLVSAFVAHASRLIHG